MTKDLGLRTQDFVVDGGTWLSQRCLKREETPFRTVLALSPSEDALGRLPAGWPASRWRLVEPVRDPGEPSAGVIQGAAGGRVRLGG